LHRGTTLDEYRKHVEKDAALERRFQPVIVDQPTVEDTILDSARFERTVRSASRSTHQRFGVGLSGCVVAQVYHRPFSAGQGIDLSMRQQQSSGLDRLYAGGTR
jgi:hypothetical protein